MSKLQKRYAVSGTGLEKLLDLLKKQGFTLYGVRRVQARCLEFSVPVRQSRALEEWMEQRGFSIRELPAKGLLQFLTSVRRRRLLMAFSIFACCFCILFLQCIWDVQVTGAGIYRGEVNGWLREQKIHAGILKKSVDLDALCEGLLYRLPQIAWVRARIDGVTLSIEITEGVPAPSYAAPDENGNIVAACDGVIHTIDVFAGTAAVSPGQSVKKGQVLIKGEERNGLDNSVKSVHARGKVMARIWKSADSLVSASAIVSHPTGRTADILSVSTPWFSLSRSASPNYLTWDMETEKIPVGSAWIPLWIDKTRYTELYLEKATRDIEEAKREAGQLAMHNLLLKCAKNDVIIDKSLNFSMIEGDNIQATATAELIADIGIFAPQTSD